MNKKNNQKTVAVTIPIYKEKPDEIECISLRQCLNVLGKHPIIFFAPYSLNTSFYETFCSDKITFAIERFDDQFFTGIQGYNRLMLSKSFYKRFENYKFILIYQLDAFVFKDELTYWCNQGYDYIGAPYTFINMDTYPMKVLTKFRATLKFFNKYIPGSYRFKQVGNGGLSLRNIRKTLFLLNFKKLQPTLWSFLMEDNFFQYWGNLMFIFFRLPTEKNASLFSIELEPSRSLVYNDGELPFGCHAFMRYEPEFWIPIIEKEGYDLSNIKIIHSQR